MKKILFLLLFLGLFGLTALEAQKPHKPNKQHQRIHHGIHNGSLTRLEVKQLLTQQKRIRIATKVAKADGWVSPGEKRLLSQSRKQADHQIYHKKHNSRRRF